MCHKNQKLKPLITTSNQPLTAAKQLSQIVKRHLETEDESETTTAFLKFAHSHNFDRPYYSLAKFIEVIHDIEDFIDQQESNQYQLLHTMLIKNTKSNITIH